MKKILLFVALVFAMDQATGYLLNLLYLRTTSGEAGGLINYALRQHPEVIVLGSSRAKHHVSPGILGRKLNATVFNAGINGQGFLYTVMLLDLWTRYQPPPKVILLHVDTDFLSRSEKEIQKTSVFSAYYNKSDRIRSIINLKGTYEWIKYYSYTYRFNGKFFSIIKNIAKKPDPLFNGYFPLTGSLNVGPIPTDISVADSGDKSMIVWDLKIKYLHELAAYCKTNGVRLILFHSPRFGEDSASLSTWSKGLVTILTAHDGAEFLDLSKQSNALFAGHPELFKDTVHLNKSGAELFSQLLADEVAKRIQPIR